MRTLQLQCQSQERRKSLLYLGITELQNAVCLFFFLNEMDKYIRLDITCRMFFFELIQKSKENIMKQLTRKEEKKKKPVIHPASTLST